LKQNFSTFGLTAIIQVKKSCHHSVLKKNYARPSIFKFFINLLQTHDKTQVHTTAMYLKLTEKSRTY